MKIYLLLSALLLLCSARCLCASTSIAQQRPHVVAVSGMRTMGSVSLNRRDTKQGSCIRANSEHDKSGCALFAEGESVTMRLRGGGVSEDEDDLPEVELPIQVCGVRFDVTLRLPFIVSMGGHAGEERWAAAGVRRFVSYTGRREPHKLVVETCADETLLSLRERIMPLVGKDFAKEAPDENEQEWYFSLNERVPLAMETTLRQNGIANNIMITYL